MAQEQDRMMLDRLLKPDLSIESNMAQKEFQGGRALGDKRYSAGGFSGTREFRSKEFSTRSFFGIRNPWFGRKVYDATASSLASRSARDASRSFATESFSARDFVQADRAFAKSQAEEPVRSFTLRGATQGAMDDINAKTQSEITIDEVRAILNTAR